MHSASRVEGGASAKSSSVVVHLSFRACCILHKTVPQLGITLRSVPADKVRDFFVHKVDKALQGGLN